VSAGLSPDCAAPAPHRGLLRRLLAAAAERAGRGRVALVLPDGTRLPAARAPAAEIVLRRHRALWRVLAGGGIGLAESYMDGDWDTPDLPGLLALLAEAHRGAGVPVPLGPWHRLMHLARPNTRRGSRRNIAAHYDLGNDFFRLWLDPGMTYSAALFAAPDDTLEQAQRRKYRRLADLLGLRPGLRVLEIGCGWGGFAEMAAREYGCRVVAITLSRAQLQYARERIARAGLCDRVELLLQDYREVGGAFDRVAAIEMFEAVGERNWPAFFGLLRRRLVPGGMAALQVITIAESRFARYRRRADFIQRYIFPGGMLPSPDALRRAAAAAGLRPGAAETFGPSYARTLAEWHRAFDHAWPAVAGLGFDERFRRMWKFYLAYCEGGFRAGAIDVGQYRFDRP
jgi:cyclopropane-fatty-acyl-phospholipid synthase